MCIFSSSFPYGLLQDVECSSLCCTARSGCLSILCVIVCIFIVPNSQCICCLINSSFYQAANLPCQQFWPVQFVILQPICGIEGTLWCGFLSRWAEVKWPPAYSRWFVNQLQSPLGAVPSPGLCSFSVTRGSVLLSYLKKTLQGTQPLSCSWNSIVTWQAGLPGGPLLSFSEGWGLIIFFSQEEVAIMVHQK